MTLALHGKSRNRQWLLVAAAMLAIFASIGAGLMVRSTANAESTTIYAENGGGVTGTVACAPDRTDAQEWHWVINGLGNPPPDTQAPASITAVFVDAGSVVVALDAGYTLGDPVAHYTLVAHLGDTLISTSAEIDGEYTQFRLSHWPCGQGEPPQDTLNVFKTANTSFTRTHDWSIEKAVDPDELWLYTNGSGDANVEWTVTVTYDGYTDSDFVIYGEITIENPNDDPVTIDSVVDDLGLAGYDDIDLVCVDEAVSPVTFPATLASEATITCTYSEGFTEKPADDGTNTVTVAWSDSTGEPAEDATDTADWEFGDPTTEVNKTVNVYDVFEDEDPVLLGTLDADDFEAGDTEDFKYDKDFAWADFGRNNCGDHSYDNTASVIGDDDEVLDTADATLVVHVQCLVGDTAWAANGNVAGQTRYTSRGNWATYVAYAVKTTTLFAGQTKNAGTVSFSAVSGGNVTISVSLAAGWYFVPGSDNLMVQGYATAPSGNPSPGLFANKKQCGAAENPCSIVVPSANYYGVHANVEGPDPSFGP